jgi:hypothetical protein
VIAVINPSALKLMEMSLANVMSFMKLLAPMAVTASTSLVNFAKALAEIRTLSADIILTPTCQVTTAHAKKAMLPSSLIFLAPSVCLPATYIAATILGACCLIKRGVFATQDITRKMVLETTVLKAVLCRKADVQIRIRIVSLCRSSLVSFVSVMMAT